MLQKLVLRALLVLRSAASRIVAWTERTETVLLTDGADKPSSSGGGAPEHWLRYIRDHMEGDAQTFDMKAVSSAPSFDLSPDFALTVSGSTDDPTSTDQPQADELREPPLSPREIWLRAIRQLTVSEVQSAETRQDADKPESTLTEAREEPAVHAVAQATPAAQAKQEQPIAGAHRNSWRVEQARPSFESSRRVDMGERSDFLAAEPVRDASTPSVTPSQARVEPTNGRGGEHFDSPQNQDAPPGALIAPPSSNAAAVNLGTRTWRGGMQVSPHHARTSTAEVPNRPSQGVIDQAVNIPEDVARKSYAPLLKRAVSDSDGVEKANSPFPFQTAVHQPHPIPPILNGDTREAPARSSPSIPSEPQYSGFSDHWVELPELLDDGSEPQHEAESLKAKYQRRLDSEQLAANTLWNAQHS